MAGIKYHPFVPGTWQGVSEGFEAPTRPGHHGDDLAARFGTPIYAPADGFMAHVGINDDPKGYGSDVRPGFAPHKIADCHDVYSEVCREAFQGPALISQLTYLDDSLSRQLGAPMTLTDSFVVASLIEAFLIVLCVRSEFQVAGITAGRIVADRVHDDHSSRDDSTVGPLPGEDVSANEAIRQGESPVILNSIPLPLPAFVGTTGAHIPIETVIGRSESRSIASERIAVMTQAVVVLAAQVSTANRLFAPNNFAVQVLLLAGGLRLTTLVYAQRCAK